MIIKQITKKNGLNQFFVRNEHYQGSTVKSQFLHHHALLLCFVLDLVLSKMPNNAVGFLHYSLIRGPYFSRRQGSNQLLVFCIIFTRTEYFSFSILHTHFLRLQISCIPSLGHCKTSSKWLMTHPLDMMDFSFSLIRS